MFADPNPKELVVEEEELEEEVEEEEEVEDEEAEEEEETPKPKDKKTAAIIREKQENKELKRRIAELERKEAEQKRSSYEAEVKRKLDESDNEYRKRLVSKGYDEEEIEERVADRRERAEIKHDLKQQKYERQAEKLVGKYPDVLDKLDQFIGIAEKSGLTLEEVCRAKLGESSAYEIKTKAEQEILLNKTKAAEKKTVPGTQKNDTVKFSKEDESSYQFYLQKNPGVTRARYKEILEARRY